jgi:hypothetical protein
MPVTVSIQEPPISGSVGHSHLAWCVVYQLPWPLAELPNVQYIGQNIRDLDTSGRTGQFSKQSC